ncbi:hypothetical protein AciX9_4525 (plasmid) [Granulicella tundricola MP5ACTX9]|uniref:Uncharacterized protein n=1 Tax=Granulicella tundricola (strain ATCC BAA-1859 / DSM 23138 / MP5ACTX9) TaxID=1198114 RepID=E8X7N2_GRATM|nr:hypothetical protein AciX9_4525 [Granulicella tundricola MP5ACTX9]
MVDVTSHTRDELTSKGTVGERASEVELQDAFDEFFGIRSDDDPPGVIILQSDLLDAKHTQSDSRFFKARNVIDSCDLQGAFFLQKAFKWRPVPRLVVSDHNTQNGLDETVPFKIAMGLGFTDETSRVMESRDYGSWMSISREGGDALSLHEKLKPSLNKSRFRTETDPDPEKPGFVRVLPSDWDAKYIKAWERMLPPKNGPRVSDYAVLLRHTYNRQILFVVAGFTERGTSIGAAHLAANWSKLWEQYVQGNAYKRGLGDFLVLIAGPSDVNCLGSLCAGGRFDDVGV